MNGDLHVDPLFSAKQRYIWTSDTVSGGSRVWVAVFYLGLVHRYGVGNHYYVRPVRSGQKRLDDLVI
jgi:hypothetical protein